jgi:hypothetical protein
MGSLDPPWDGHSWGLILLLGNYSKTKRKKHANANLRSSDLFGASRIHRDHCAEGIISSVRTSKAASAKAVGLPAESAMGFVVESLAHGLFA